jgi:hypothetical protein
MGVMSSAAAPSGRGNGKSAAGRNNGQSPAAPAGKG